MLNAKAKRVSTCVVCSFFTALPNHAAGGATYTPGSDQHLDMQHQVGAKTHLDCGRAAEADMRDNSWKTIERFWIHSKARAYSSASFLIDKNGIIVWGHDLGRLEKDTPAALSLHQEIDKLLVAEK